MRALNIISEISMRLLRFLVDVFANIMNIIVSLIIILLNVYVSWNHTLELFHKAGFTRQGYMDIAGVCAVELTFLLGSCHIIGARMKGRVPGIGSILTGCLGVALIMWSNISAGVSHGITGVIIGIVVPLSIIACETILADAWRTQVQTQTTPEEQEEPKLSDNRLGQLIKENRLGQLIKELKNSDKAPKIENIVGHLKEESDNDYKVSEEPKTDTKQEAYEEPKTDIKQEEHEEAIPDTKQKESEESKTDTKHKPSREHKASREPKTDNISGHTKEESDEKNAFTLAVRLMKETGNLPSIRTLAREAKVSKYRAGKIIEELKQTAV